MGLVNNGRRVFKTGPGQAEHMEYISVESQKKLDSQKLPELKTVGNSEKKEKKLSEMI